MASFDYNYHNSAVFLTLIRAIQNLKHKGKTKELW